MLLPSATVFLLMLCNDKAVLGPWVNGRATNAFTGAVIALLIMLSLILVASVVFPGIGARQIIMIIVDLRGRRCRGGRRAADPPPGRDRRCHDNDGRPDEPAVRSSPDRTRSARRTGECRGWPCWRQRRCPRARRVGMAGMWVYLAIAMSAVVFRIIQVAIGH